MVEVEESPWRLLLGYSEREDEDEAIIARATVWSMFPLLKDIESNERFLNQVSCYEVCIFPTVSSPRLLAMAIFVVGLTVVS